MESPHITAHGCSRYDQPQQLRCVGFSSRLAVNAESYRGSTRAWIQWVIYVIRSCGLKQITSHSLRETIHRLGRYRPAKGSTASNQERAAWSRPGAFGACHLV